MRVGMRVSNWKPQQFDGQFIAASMERLERAAEVIAAKARQRVPVGTVTRSAGSGKYWMEREPGSLKRSIRVVKKNDGTSRNVRVYAGNKKVFYARLVEYGSIKKGARPFLRPALNSSKAEIKSALGVT
jgi:HK97 gp10 family phage protein